MIITRRIIVIIIQYKYDNVIDCINESKKFL